MLRKTYKIQEDVPMSVAEPAVAYGRNVAHRVSTNEWNPNVPFHCTQDEFTEHIHRIEQGNFTPLEEANKEFEAWKKDYLASRLK